ncbi:3-dehydroquinate synthase [Alkaliphilus oremlandii]|uniref:3-dehydroquinate synthase n=1 Tax=Alkaliphilus oremlandii (strain OhILAs) TaxID=350688 RepID=AROB_ALKOO|nr:3-dehydroquinate synthase [Alkaliphilus oremlandii]A8MH15.1 RecName: Full=3-dehydroquinate synthase; Short=DHQS [Alkaliphilus oremlandii OhILAs]ABW18902.1 3-dehydroquinate synthase [Alkaliphilus oremlandii OhILAs]
MLETKINLGKVTYPLYMGRNLLDNLDVLIEDHIEGKTVFLLTEDNVFKYYGNPLLEKLKSSRFKYHIIESGETSKSIDTYGEIIHELTENKQDRDTIILALGGGVIGDLGGFVASTYMRGVDLIHIPTTLLAQIDSSIGGKTGINFGAIKNLLGTFYHPRAVYMDLSTLDTLPKREYIAAFGEIIKYGLIGDYDLLLDLDQHHRAYLDRTRSVDDLILKCIRMKENIVLKDERDSGMRQVLNLGHTFAHGLESSTNFQKFLHGEAVALGLIFASNLSLKLKFIAEEYHQFVNQLIYKYFSDRYILQLDTEGIVEAMTMDKKNKEHRITFILPVDKEKVEIFKNIPIEIVEESLEEIKYGFRCK